MIEAREWVLEVCVWNGMQGGGERVWQWMKYRDDDEGERGGADGWRWF